MQTDQIISGGPVAVVQENTDTLAEQGYCIVDLAATADELDFVCARVKNIFAEAMAAGREDPKYRHFTSKTERGSLPITIAPEVERTIRSVVSRSRISDFAKSFWHVDSLLYSQKFSMFRYVDPTRDDQKGYSRLHIDNSFLHADSINVCIPLTAYGHDCPGLEIFPGIYRKITEEEAAILPSVEPHVALGKCICFTDKIPHRRTSANKTKTRINCEFRLFPAGTNQSKGLVELPGA